MITLPSEIHEAPIAPLVSYLDYVTNTIGHDQETVDIRVDTNTLVDGDSISGEPDILMRIWGNSFRKDLFTRRKVLCMECAFSQKDEDVMAKLEGFIHDIPELLVVGKITIEETQYSAPTKFPSFASKVQQESTWFPDRNAGNNFGPIIQDGVTWINIQSIKVHIWVRLSKDPINLEDHSPGGYAVGVMYNMAWHGMKCH